MTSLDKKYIQYLAPYLQRFKQKKDNLWNFRCPYCGDSKKNKIRTRGFIFLDKTVYIFKCHNCGKSTHISQLIKYLDVSLYRQYMLETFGHSKIEFSSPIIPEQPKTEIMIKTIDDIIEPISKLPNEHWVISYITQRQIPKKFWNDLYYAPSFKEFVQQIYPKNDKKLYENDQRLIIPFYDENHRFIGFQGRTLNNDKIKYITIKFNEEDLKVYGLDRIEKDKSIQVVEGPIDSMFLTNAVATCDFDLSRAAKYLPKQNLILVWDNQYNNKDIIRSLLKAIDDGFTVCIFPKEIKFKDINDMIIGGMTLQQVDNLISQNLYFGLRAKIEITNR